MKRLIRLLKIAIWTPPMVLMMAGGSYVYGVLKPPVRLVDREVTVEVEKKQKPLKELLNTIPPQYGISPLLMAAIIERESGGRANAIRFEPSQMGRAAKFSKNPDEQRMYASSHGLAQIMGWWSPEFNLNWSQLYDPETNITTASQILKRCFDRAKEKSKVDQIRSACSCYNGSTVYGEAIVNRLGELLIERSL